MNATSEEGNKMMDVRVTIFRPQNLDGRKIWWTKCIADAMLLGGNHDYVRCWERTKRFSQQFVHLETQLHEKSGGLNVYST
jgi:hypothetical protein